MRVAREVDASAPQPGVWCCGSFLQSLPSLGDPSPSFTLEPSHPPYWFKCRQETHLGPKDTGSLEPSRREKLLSPMYRPEGDATSCPIPFPPHTHTFGGHHHSQLAREKLLLRGRNGLGCV